MSDTVVLHLSQSDAFRIYNLLQSHVNTILDTVHTDNDVSASQQLLDRYKQEIHLNS
jgi:hypothetical protein